MSLASGTRFGPYEITALVGVGGMGEVYRAHDARLARDVAIKLLPASLMGDAGRVARFEQEAKILAALNHSNIAHVYGVERGVGTTALVMELVEGPTLAERIARGPIACDEALRIAAQIADALEAAHERGIVHRDLKPANIKLRADGAVKVLDFGIAKALDPTRATAAALMTAAETQTDFLLGTVAYMSPEQARGLPVDQRTDIWTFGCVLYEMLTGQEAFGGDDTAIVLARVLEGHADLDALPRVPPSVRRTLELCFEKDPRRRLRHIGDVRLALQGGFESSSSDAPRAGSRSRIAWAGFAVATAVAAAVSAIHFGENAGRPAQARLQLTLPAGVSANTFALSPDGQSLLLQIQTEGMTKLVIRSIDSVELRELPGTEGAGRGFWSADGRHVGFSLRGALKRVAAAGGPAQEIVGDGVSAAGCWGNDEIVFQNTSGGLSRVADSGGDVTVVTAPVEGELHHESPTCLPDGRFLYFRHAEERGASAIYIGRTDLTPAEQSSAPLIVADDGPLFVPDRHGDQLLFMKGDVLYAQQLQSDRVELVGEPIRVADDVASATGSVYFTASGRGAVVYREAVNNDVQLTWFDREGRVTGTLLEPKSTLRGLKIAPDGRRAAIAQSPLGQRINNDDVWVVPFDGGPSTRLTSDAAIETSPVWSPDGARIAFASSRESRRAIYQQYADGGPAAELLSIPVDPVTAAMLPNDWSRDGRFIVGTALSREFSGDLRILTLSSDSSEPRAIAPLLATAFSETAPSFSPDGRWIAYASDESGRTEVYVRSFAVSAGGMPLASDSSQRLVSSGALGAPRWRADGGELLYVADDGKLMSVEIATADGTLVTRAPRPLFQLPTAYVRRPGALTSTVLMDILPDASRILVPVPVEDSSSSTVQVVLNWR
jgi:Tol biopolymer transport system component